jgi:hypothetical protein
MLLGSGEGCILHSLLNVSQLEFRISCDNLGGSLSVGQRLEGCW